MPDLSEVIRALENCLRGDYDVCAVCPYLTRCNDSGMSLRQDALTLLKEYKQAQKPKGERGMRRTYLQTIEALNTMIPEIHANAISHGWWEGNRSPSEIYALIHSELSEALEEYRDGKTDVCCTAYGSDWCHICYGDAYMINPDIDCMTCYAQRADSEKVPNKPEGIMVELADAVIRIMDYLGRNGKSFGFSAAFTSLDTDNDLTALIACSHAELSQAFLDRDMSGDKEIAELSAVMKFIFDHMANYGRDLVEIICLKHAYNLTRPYKHGGKII